MEISVVPSIAVRQHRLRVYGMDQREVEREIPLTPCRTSLTQPTKIKVVGTFHVPSTQNPGKSSTADGTTERACYIPQNAAKEPSGQKKTAEDEPRRSNFCCFEQNLDKKPSALAEQRDYEGDFVEVFLAAFFLATFFLVAAFLGAAAFLAAAFLATFFFVAPAFFLATDTSSEMRKLWLPQYSIIRSSR